jgi:hypothetical protein
MHSARLHYTYMSGLGGCRHASRDSLNPGWHNASFRGFADYMQMPEFREHLDDLIRLAKSERIASVCAEAVRRPALSEARGYPIPFQYRRETEYNRILKGGQWL